MTEEELDSVVGVKALPVVPDLIQEQLTIVEELDKAGLTNENLVAKHKELINYPNPTVNLKALELAYRLKNLLREQLEHSGKIEVSDSLKEARNRLLSYETQN